MPVSRAREDSVPKCLQPYDHHKLSLEVRGREAVGDCPFCGREGKFSVEVDTSRWKCWVCGAGNDNGGGNSLTFIRLLHEWSMFAKDGSAEEIAIDRKLVSPETVLAWGVCKSIIDGSWLVPGYGVNGKLDQLYRRTRIFEKGEWVWRLLPTPGIWPEGKVHALHLPNENTGSLVQNIWVMEGPWDGLAISEVIDATSIAVIAIPGCNVWRDEWTQLCRGKHVTLWFDSDHPKEYARKVSRAGYDGMHRVAKKLHGVAASVKYIKWGEGGYDPDKPSGWDVRDHLSSGPNRGALLSELLAKIEPVPARWVTATPSTNGQVAQHPTSESRPCSTWEECREAWIDAEYNRRDVLDGMSVLLAICASTMQAGNQLFLDLVGSPGSAKTTLCKGLLVSKYCIHLENATKLLSGFKKQGDPDKDCSFLARANGKTWVTCEFDTIASSPQYHELMGKVRRIFDGETSATYGNSDEDRIYKALRTPWIRALTPKMMDYDQSQLGDRFLRFIIADPSEREKRQIARAALRSERTAMLETSNGANSSLVDPKTRLAQALTGGYVDWLRENVEKKLAEVVLTEEAEDKCIDLAELSANLRARPNEDKRRMVVEGQDGKELPTRLARQNVRLAACLAVVLNKREVDSDVMRVVRKVALDTAHGHSLSIVQWLHTRNPKAVNEDGESIIQSYQQSGGLTDTTLEMWTGMTKDRLLNYLMFLQKIGVLVWKKVNNNYGAWVLTDQMCELYLRVMED